MRNKFSTDQFPNQLSKVRSDSSHPILQILSQILSIKPNLNHLLSQSTKMHLILLQNLRAHRDLRRFPHLRGNLLRHNFKKLIIAQLFNICTHPNQIHRLRVRDVISDDLLQLWEMPRVPFLEAHSVIIELFV